MFFGCHCEASEATKHTEVVAATALKAEKFLKGESRRALATRKWGACNHVQT